jgi:hypothetical protein
MSFPAINNRNEPAKTGSATGYTISPENDARVQTAKKEALNYITKNYPDLDPKTLKITGENRPEDGDSDASRFVVTASSKNTGKTSDIGIIDRKTGKFEPFTTQQRSTLDKQRNEQNTKGSDTMLNLENQMKGVTDLGSG